MKTILSLPPVLQEVWSRAYAATVQGVHAGLQSDERLNDGEPAAMAERDAWEAVRRANGGEMPGEPRKVDDKTGKCSAMREALLWFADEGHYGDTYRHGAGFVDAVGLTKAREALGIPIDRDDRSLMPLAEALTHSVTIEPGVDEPTDEEMVEALAKIVANAVSPGTDPEVLDLARRSLIEEDVPDLDGDMLAASIAAFQAWKAARAWGRK